MPRHAGDTRARLFIDAPLAADGAIALAPEHAHYLRRVLRLEAGTPVAVFNGRDGEWRCVVESLGKSAGSLAVTTRLRAQTQPPDLWLAFAPMKKARLDFLIEKAVELGVTRLLPVMTRNTDAARVNTERLRAQAVEAAEQCERLCVPAVADTVSLAVLLAGWPVERPLLVGDETGTGAPIAAAAQGLGRRDAGFLIGPPGGFDAGELDALRKQSFVSLVGLGPRILRAETAALSAIAVWQAVAGDWRGDVPDRARD